MARDRGRHDERPLVFEPGSPMRMLAARFRPGGALPFLGVAADELTDLVADSTEVGIRWLARSERLERARFADAGALERALLERLEAIAMPDPVVSHAVSVMSGAAPPSVATLAREIG